MPDAAIDVQINSRTLARLISNAGFRKMATPTGAKTYGRQLKRTVEKGGTMLPINCSLQYLLDHSYAHLQQDYRHEYVYKTKLLSDFVLQHYTFHDTIILNEFRLGKSVADMVLINGTNKVFEIKTELDNADRLTTQLSDYFKVFSAVYLVTHYSLTEKYKAIIDEKVGIIEFDERSQLLTNREAISDNSGLCNQTMMKSLRKGEFLDIVRQLFGVLPDVQPVKLYKACLELTNTIEPARLQRYYLDALKLRSV
ncbi:MAG: sce7726 family protein, partial [Bacteroidetes bacterium]|nr:sce7726 family protein [Bacteroidota bacterium]